MQVLSKLLEIAHLSHHLTTVNWLLFNHLIPFYLLILRWCIGRPDRSVVYLMVEPLELKHFCTVLNRLVREESVQFKGCLLQELPVECQRRCARYTVQRINTQLTIDPGLIVTTVLAFWILLYLLILLLLLEIAEFTLNFL